MSDVEKRSTPVPADWTYAPAPESRDVVKIRESYDLFIGGEWVAPRSGERFATTSPATEEHLADVAQAGPEDVADAVSAARQAFGPWAALPGSERAKYLFRIARILQERAREFAVLESIDGGKPRSEEHTSELQSH